MANDGWFKCESCGKDSVKILVKDDVKVLERPCHYCGGKMVKT